MSLWASTSPALVSVLRLNTICSSRITLTKRGGKVWNTNICTKKKNPPVLPLFSHSF